MAVIERNPDGTFGPTPLAIQREEKFPNVWGWDNTGFRLERVSPDKIQTWNQELGQTINRDFLPLAEAGVHAIYRALERVTRPETMARFEKKSITDPSLWQQVVNKDMTSYRPDYRADSLFLHGLALINATKAATVLKESGTHQEIKEGKRIVANTYTLTVPEKMRFPGFVHGITTKSIQLQIPVDVENQFRLSAQITIDPKGILSKPNFPIRRRNLYSATLYANAMLVPNTGPDIDIVLDEGIQQPRRLGGKTVDRLMYPFGSNDTPSALPKLAALTFLAANPSAPQR